MEYQIFILGLASTPHTVTLECVTTGEIIQRICVARPTGRATRERYNKVIKLLNKKYKSILN